MEEYDDYYEEDYDEGELVAFFNYNGIDENGTFDTIEKNVHYGQFSSEYIAECIDQVLADDDYYNEILLGPDWEVIDEDLRESIIQEESKRLENELEEFEQITIGQTDRWHWEIWYDRV